MLKDFDASSGQEITFKKAQLQKRLGISSDNDLQLQPILDYLLGSVKTLRVTTPGEWFAANRFLGNKNKRWDGSPLRTLVGFYRDKGRGDRYAHNRAGVAVGYILKYLLANNQELTVYTRRRYRREYLIKD